MKRTAVLSFLLLPVILVGQFEFEPSAEHPFGLPNPEAPKELMDFAPMIGECDCTSQMRKPDQTWAEPEPMVWRFKYIMNGMAVQDETLRKSGTYAGSIRQFIADSTRWYVHYYSHPLASPSLPTWEGNKTEEGNIILHREQKAPNGMDGFYRLTFYEIEDSGFKWVGEWVDKAESIVFPTWKIDCSKGKRNMGHEKDKISIIEATKRFSKAYMESNYEAIANSYTKDAKIFPGNLNIISGRDSIKSYWMGGSGKVLHHEIVPEEIKFFGNYAHDYGYYQGKSTSKDGKTSEWKGKYVVIWKKEDGDWKMYLDIWNRVRI
nr:DUF4440 domain-containing protein [Allomuricauda sp.]